MEVRCQHCGHAFSVGDDAFGDRDKAELPCPACKRVVEVVNPKLATLRIERTRKKVPQVLSQVSPEGRLLVIPWNQEISLQVLEGEEKGTVYPVNKPRFLIGRAHSDVVVNDSLVSRVHCVLEISDDGVLLKDLESTNGTLVDEKPIHTAPLASGSTFRIGTHVFQLVITPKKP